MNKSVFDVFEAFDRFFDSSVFSSSFFQDEKSTYVCPAFPPVNASIHPDKKDLRFEFAMAGIDQSRVNLSFSGDFMEMTISPDKEEKEERNYLVKGIKSIHIQTNKYYVPMSRYDTAAAKAEFKNGMLVVDIPVKEDVKPKQVEIKVVR